MISAVILALAIGAVEEVGPNKQGVLMYRTAGRAGECVTGKAGDNACRIAETYCGKRGLKAAVSYSHGGEKRRPSHQVVNFRCVR